MPSPRSLILIGIIFLLGGWAAFLLVGPPTGFGHALRWPAAFIIGAICLTVGLMTALSSRLFERLDALIEGRAELRLSDPVNANDDETPSLADIDYSLGNAMWLQPSRILADFERYGGSAPTNESLLSQVFLGVNTYPSSAPKERAEQSRYVSRLREECEGDENFVLARRWLEAAGITVSFGVYGEPWMSSALVSISGPRSSLPILRDAAMSVGDSASQISE